MTNVWRFTWSYVRINDGVLSAVLLALEGAACPKAPPETAVGGSKELSNHDGGFARPAAPGPGEITRENRATTTSAAFLALSVVTWKKTAGRWIVAG
jgi:hypothetical protein